MTSFRASLILLVIAAILHAIWFHHVYQAVYYFAILTSILWLVPKLQLPFTVVGVAWVLIWVDSLGTFYDLYGRFSWYDDFSHAIVSACATVFMIAFIKTLFPNQSPGLTLLAGCTSAIAIMAGYEVLEYWIQHVSGIRFIWSEFDTALDLQADIIGAFLGTGISKTARRLHQ